MFVNRHSKFVIPLINKKELIVLYYWFTEIRCTVNSIDNANSGLPRKRSLVF